MWLTPSCPLLQRRATKATAPILSVCLLPCLATPRQSSKRTEMKHCSRSCGLPDASLQSSSSVWRSLCEETGLDLLNQFQEEASLEESSQINRGQEKVESRPEKEEDLQADVAKHSPDLTQPPRDPSHWTARFRHFCRS